MQISLATFVQNKVIRSIMQSFFLICVQCNSYYSGDVNYFNGWNKFNGTVWVVPVYV